MSLFADEDTEAQEWEREAADGKRGRYRNPGPSGTTLWAPHRAREPEELAVTKPLNFPKRLLSSRRASEPGTPPPESLWPRGHLPTLPPLRGTESGTAAFKKSGFPLAILLPAPDFRRAAGF